MKRVIIESPYTGDEKQIQINEIYGEFCMHDCLVNHNESPYASHLLYTRNNVLRDEIPKDRKLGIEAGFYWRDVADQTNFYIDLGMTKGMYLGKQDIQKKGKTCIDRKLPQDLWTKFVEVCVKSDLGLIYPKNIPERLS